MKIHVQFLRFFLAPRHKRLCLWSILGASKCIFQCRFIKLITLEETDYENFYDEVDCRFILGYAA